MDKFISLTIIFLLVFNIFLIYDQNYKNAHAIINSINDIQVYDISVKNETIIYNTTKHHHNYKTYNNTVFFNQDIPIREIRYCGNKAIQYSSNGMSMYPYIVSGQKYWAEPIIFEDIEIGDVIVYRKDGKLIHHAVANKYSDRLYTIGYYNRNKDSTPVYPNQIVARDCIKE